jgi:hypothetical protein
MSLRLERFAIDSGIDPLSLFPLKILFKLMNLNIRLKS